MQLSQSQANAVKRGDKTELRRPWSSRSPYRDPEQAVIFERPREPTDAPAKHGDDTTVIDIACRVAISAQPETTLGATTEADARAEGFKASGKLTALAQFREWWEQRYGPWNDARRVRLVKFDLIREDDEKAIYVARSGGYTHDKKRAVDELPAVRPAEVERINDRRAKGLSTDQLQALAKQQARARAAKLRDSENKARVKGVDISAETAAIDNYLASIRQKLEEAA